MISRIESLQKMLQDEPNDSFLNYALAMEYANAGDIAQAISMLEQLIASDKDYLGTYYQLGHYHEEAQNFEKALKTYEAGIVIAKDQKNMKTVSELNQAIMMLEEEI